MVVNKQKNLDEEYVPKLAKLDEEIKRLAHDLSELEDYERQATEYKQTRDLQVRLRDE